MNGKRCALGLEVDRRSHFTFYYIRNTDRCKCFLGPDEAGVAVHLIRVAEVVNAHPDLILGESMEETETALGRSML